MNSSTVRSAILLVFIFLSFQNSFTSQTSDICQEWIRPLLTVTLFSSYYVLHPLLMFQRRELLRSRWPLRGRELLRKKWLPLVRLSSCHRHLECQALWPF